MPRKTQEDADLDAYDSMEDQMGTFCQSNVQQQLRIQQHHVKISASINIFSPIISICVGPEYMLFHVPRDLITLHSLTFRDKIQANAELALPLVKPTQFANFLIWLHSGTVSSDISPEIMPRDDLVGLTDEYEGLWALGEKLGCSGFQNYCMTKILDYGQKKGAWPTADVAHFAYKYTKTGSAFRRLVANLLGKFNPMVDLPIGSAKLLEWLQVLAVCPKLSVDMIVIAADGEIEGDAVWSEEWRENFKVAEGDLGKRWAQHILGCRDRESIEGSAKYGCIKSIIEVKHLASFDKEESTHGESDKENMLENCESDSEEQIDEF